MIGGCHKSLLSRCVALFAISVLLGGCYWSAPGFDSRRTGYNPHEGSITSANVGTLTERWSAPAGGQIVTSSGRVHGFGWPGELRSYDAADGSLVWSTPVDVGDILNPPLFVAFGNRLMFPSVEVGAPTGCLLQHDLATGAFQGCATLPAPADATTIFTLDAVRDGSWVVVTYHYGTADGPESAIAATNVSDPAQRWIVEFGIGELGYGSLITNPIVVDGIVYAGVISGATTLVGWDVDDTCTPDCDPVVEHDLPTDLLSGISADASGASIAVAADDVVYVVDRVGGDVVWTGTYPVNGYYDQRSIPTWTPTALVVPVSTNIDRPFLGLTDGTAVVAFPAEGCGAETCGSTWSAELLGQPAGQVAAAGDVVYATSMQAFAALPTSCTGTCEPLHVQEEDDLTWFSPAIVANGLVLHSDRGGLRALSLP